MGADRGNGGRPVRIVVTGGGTGGHTYPALTTVRAVRELAEEGTEPDLLWVGTANGLEARVAAENRVPFRAITTGKLRRSARLRQLGRNLVDAFRIPLGILQAVAVVARWRPDVVFSTGGYVAVPVGVAAWLFRCPLVIHEQTVTVGLANRILARLSTQVLLSHESSLRFLPSKARRRAVVTGNPVRPELLNGRREAALDAFELDPALPIVYVTGGAQGSVQINTLVAEILPELLSRCQVLHQCGELSYDRMNAVAQALPAEQRPRYRVVAYVHAELPDVLAAADIVVGRSGAGTVAELTALGKPCIFIPLVPTGGDEQRRNAAHLAEAGAARVLVGGDATGQRLLAELLALLDDPAQRGRIAAAARAHGRPDAAAAVAAALLAHAHTRTSTVLRPTPSQRAS
ncbi:MAG: UDP-N-acetylglucosamine--N-acetylmuramyl-(pentapeptide) pyrophosphoryl-undecaprenol N-acetylglucosamine transferase [Egibacteraceae bacterium]